MRFRWNYNEPAGKSCDLQFLDARHPDESFFAKGLSQLPDPAAMKDLEKAADRIITAVREKQKIIIFGDDDIDGITSTYILFDFLQTLGCMSHYYFIPNRLTDQHGIQPVFIDKVAKEGYDLVITVDNGVTDWEAVDQLNKLGVDVIITDHHLVPPKLPNAYAVVNPKQEACDFAYEMLAGVGVVYFLLMCISKKLYMDLPDRYMLWTAIGTVADKAPLDGANRIIVKQALSNWLEYEDDSLSLLRFVQDIGDDYSSRMGFIGFVTRLLSGGRVTEGEHLGLQFMLATPHGKGPLLDGLLEQKRNYEQQLRQLYAWLSDNTPKRITTHYVYVDENDDIPCQLLGTAANFVSTRHKVPSLFLKQKGEVMICEGRCTEGFNLVEAFAWATDTLIQYGGHVKAAGFSAKPHMIPLFIEKFEQYVQNNLPSITSQRKLEVDIVLEYKSFNPENLERLEKFQPFGMQNPEPVILLRGCRFDGLETIFWISNPPQTDPDMLYDVVLSMRSANSVVVLDYREAGQDTIRSAGGPKLKLAMRQS